jgi:hypothetical protein
VNSDSGDGEDEGECDRRREEHGQKKRRGIMKRLLKKGVEKE